jgi:hypothetical protein
MELDIYYPDLSLALEYQGEQHFKDSFGNLQIQQIRDKEKQEACKKQGITLIPVPFWWDTKEKSLAATIQIYRPELLLHIDSSNSD